jgi:hypothetical protein
MDLSSSRNRRGADIALCLISFGADTELRIKLLDVAL